MASRIAERPKVFLIEDEEPIRRPAHYNLEHPVLPDNSKPKTAFDVLDASCAAEARATLEAKLERFETFDVTLLDMGIPLQDNGVVDVKHGADLLQDLNGRFRSCCGSVVVLSSRLEPNVFIEVVQQGAVDFIPKTANKADLYLRCLKAVELGKERRQLAWQQYSRTRQRWEFEQMRREGLDAIRKVCSEGVRTCLFESDRLRESIWDRFGVGGLYDADDSITAGFSQLNSRLREISQNLLDNQMGAVLGDFITATANEEQVDLLGTVNETMELLRYGILLKDLKVVRDLNSTLTVQCLREDLGDVVEHAMVSVIESAAPNSNLTISLSGVANGCQLTIQSFCDGVFDPSEVIHRDRILRYVRQIAANFGAVVEQRIEPSSFAIVVSVPS
jgi:DNA-binding NarL/FixJ family response regulator